jgi:hypothetical protein
MAVLNSKAGMRGVESLFPTLLSGHPRSTVSKLCLWLKDVH